MSTEPRSADKLRCVILGHVCIDRNTVDGVFSEGWGSSCCFISHYLATRHPETSTSVIAPHGHDFIPYAEGLHLLNPPANHPTMVYRNLVERGQRAQWCEHPSPDPVPLTPAMRDELAAADIVFVAPLTPGLEPDWVRQALAQTSALKVLLPQGYLRKVAADGTVSQSSPHLTEQVIGLFDLVVYSDEDCQEAVAVAASWKRSAQKTEIVVTHNSRGASYVVAAGARAESTTDQTVSILVPTTPIHTSQITRPVGAGDVFSAALALAVKSGEGIEPTIVSAHAGTSRYLTS